MSDNLTQKQANQIIARLLRDGIPAEAEKTGRGDSAKYSVMVRRKDYAQAVGVIESNRLPSEPDVPLQELITPRGLIPNSREIEALRTDRAMAKELEDLFENHAQILSAKAVVRKFAAGGRGGEGVSLVLRVREGGTIRPEEIVPLVQRIVPAVPPDHIEVLLSADAVQAPAGQVAGVIAGDPKVPVPLVPFLRWHVPDGDREGLAIAFSLVLLAACVVGVIIGYVAGQLKTAKLSRVRELPEAPAAGVVYEKSKNEL